MDNTTLESTNKLLKVMIALMLRGNKDEQLNLRQRVDVLDELGLKPVEIAEILGRSNTYVSKELVGIRKSRKQKK